MSAQTQTSTVINQKPSLSADARASETRHYNARNVGRTCTVCDSPRQRNGGLLLQTAMTYLVKPAAGPWHVGVTRSHPLSTKYKIYIYCGVHPETWPSCPARARSAAKFTRIVREPPRYVLFTSEIRSALAVLSNWLSVFERLGAKTLSTSANV